MFDSVTPSLLLTLNPKSDGWITPNFLRPAFLIIGSVGYNAALAKALSIKSLNIFETFWILFFVN